MVTGQKRGMRKEPLGVWPVGATPLLSDQPKYFPASALPAAETLSLPEPNGERPEIQLSGEGYWTTPKGH